MYLPKEGDFTDVPEALLRPFGKPEPVMSLLLTPTKKLAKEDPKIVMENLREKGFHLQIDEVKPIDPDIAAGSIKF